MVGARVSGSMSYKGWLHVFRSGNSVTWDKRVFRDVRLVVSFACGPSMKKRRTLETLQIHI